MRLDISTWLPCTLDQAVSQVMTTRLLQYVSHPLVSFTFLDASQFPRTWTAGTHWVSLTLFGFLPFGRQAIVISIPPVETGFALRDAGHSTLIPVWNHLILGFVLIVLSGVALYAIYYVMLRLLLVLCGLAAVLGAVWFTGRKAWC